MSGRLPVPPGCEPVGSLNRSMWRRGPSLRSSTKNSGCSGRSRSCTRPQLSTGRHSSLVSSANDEEAASASKDPTKPCGRGEGYLYTSRIGCNHATPAGGRLSAWLGGIAHATWPQVAARRRLVAGAGLGADWQRQYEPVLTAHWLYAGLCSAQ